MSKRHNVSHKFDEDFVHQKKIKTDNCKSNQDSSKNNDVIYTWKPDSPKQETSGKCEPVLSTSSAANHLSEEEKSNVEIPCSLLNLSDDVLLIILEKLHPFDLLRVSRTCLRLNSLCHDRTLWMDVDFRHDVLDKRYSEPIINFDDFIEFLLPNTRSIKKSGTGDRHDLNSYSVLTTQASITSSFLKKVNNTVKSLKSLSLENHLINAQVVTLECFSSALEYLSFKNSQIVGQPRERSYFYKIDKILPNLTVLDLSGCDSFRAHSFMALSKISNLRELHLKGCRGIEDCVPYASLAATFGFRALQLLDLRLTPVNDSDISCFNRVENLKKLYLEAIDTDDDRNSRITDLGVSSFGDERVMNANFVNGDPIGLAFVLIQNHRPLRSSLETLMIRNYRSVTDISLRHAAGCLLNLKKLDIRGTCCTEKGVNDFKCRRPEVELLTDFNDTSVDV